MVLAAPVAAVAALAGWTFTPQRAGLVAVPVLALAGGLVLLGRCERMLRRIRQDAAASGAGS